MGGRLLDWLGAGATADRPLAADMPARIVPSSTAVFFATDDKILSVFDESGPAWFEIDVAAVAALMFQNLPDVDWSTPPTDGQIFEWDTTSSKLLPVNKPNNWTLEEIQDLVGAMVSNSSGMNVTYDDGLGQLVFASLIFQYTDELAQDAIAAAIAAGTHTGFVVVYDDATNKFSFEVSATYIESVVNTLSVDELSDVDTTTTPPTNGQILKWDSVAGKWKPGVASTVGSIDDLTDVDTSTVAPTNKQMLEWDSVAGKWKPGAALGNPLNAAATGNSQLVIPSAAAGYWIPKEGAAAVPTAANSSDCLSVTFTLLQPGWVTFNFAAILNRTTGLMRSYITDTAGARIWPTRVGSGVNHENTFHSFSMAEGNGQEINYSGAVYVAAGTHTWVVNITHVNTAVATTIFDRLLSVNLPAEALIPNQTSQPAAGTVFPVSPTNGDRFFRTDRGIEYFWNSTAALWLSTNLYSLGFQSLQNIAVTSTFYQMIPQKADYSIYLEKWQTCSYLASTGVWDIRLEYDNSANVATVLATNSTSGDAATTWINKSANINAVLSANARNLRINGVKTSGGNLYGTGAVSYRLVG